MKYTIENTIMHNVSDSSNAKAFLNFIVEKYVKFDKDEKGEYMFLLEKTIYDGVSDVLEHIMKLMHYCNQLKSMNIYLGG